MFRSGLAVAALVVVAGCTAAGSDGATAVCATSGGAVSGGRAGCVEGSAAQQRDAMLTRRAIGLGR